MKDRLRLYSYFKQGTCDDAPSEPPPAYMVVAHAKHASWTRRRGLARRVARATYVSLVHELSSSWEATAAATATAAITAAISAAQPLAAAGATASASIGAPLAPPSAAGALATESALRARIVQLEASIARLTKQTMRGWLHKYSPDAVSWLGSGGSKWERRFFALVPNQELVYYRGETDATPRRTIALANCVVVNEGLTRTRRGHTYHLFSLYLVGTLHSERGPGSGALIRVSCADELEMARWLEALEAATGNQIRTLDANRTVASPPPPMRYAAKLLHTGTTPSAAGAATDGSRGRAAPARASLAGVGGASPPPPPPPPQLTVSGGADALSIGGGGADGGEAAPAPAAASTPPTVPAPSPTTPGGSRKPRAPFDPNLFPASRPMHHAAKPSLLSGGGGAGGGGLRGGEPANLAGFVNLGFLLFVASNSRMLLENLLQYGLRISLPNPVALASFGERDVADLDAVVVRDGVDRALRTAAVLLLPILCAFYIERAAVRRTPLSRYSRKCVDPLHALNVFASLAAPCTLISMRLHYGGVGGGVLLLLASVTCFLKCATATASHHRQPAHTHASPPQPPPRHRRCPLCRR